jgi:DtxR family Mn-dependent transcriptional regulator
MILENRNNISQDYLRAILHIEAKDGIASNNSLSKELGISGASVTEMLNKLSNQGLMNYKPYQGASLTKKGKKLALEITRRHRLWEVFLSEKLGFDWDEIHILAHKFEHIVSEKLIHRLDDFLGNPTHDPHGDPIPDKNGWLPDENLIQLSEIKSKRFVHLSKIEDENPEVLKYFTNIGLQLNSSVKILEIYLFDGSIRIKYKSKEIIISKKLAESIFVKN